MKENLKAWTKRRFMARKAILEAAGWKVTNRWRKGCKAIKLEPIVLSERASE